MLSAKAVNPIRVPKKSDSTSVNSLALNRSGQVLAAGSREQTVHLWGTATGRKLRTLHAHKNYIQAFAFDSTGTVLASGGLDGWIKTWDVDSGKAALVLWDWPTGKLCLTLDPGGEPAAHMTFAPDCRSLVTGGSSTPSLENGTRGMGHSGRRSASATRGGAMFLQSDSPPIAGALPPRSATGQPISSAYSSQSSNASMVGRALFPAFLQLLLPASADQLWVKCRH